MTQDFRKLLKESGYLSSPATRFFWRNATPTLRGHLRQWLLLALSTAVPPAAMAAGLTLLPSWGDRAMLFGFYALAIGLAFGLLDLAIGIAPLARFERFWRRMRLLDWLPIPLSGALLATAGLLLEDAIAPRPWPAKLAIWALLALFAWIAANSCALLVVSRLYWHGIAPPRMRHYPALMALAAAGLVAFFLVREPRGEAVPPRPESRPPTLILAFDAPEPLFDAYLAALPDWPRQEFEVPQRDITAFWTSFGTGAPQEAHQSSLIAYRTPLFRANLNRRDPTQRPPLMLFRWLGHAEPLAGGGRYRKHLWEILGESGLQAYAYAFWHTHPATGRYGGALSERWTADHEGPPYLAGVKPAPVQRPLPLAHPDAPRPTIERENQTWAQLHRRAAQGDFDICAAYFPLADQLDALPVADREAAQQTLLTHRQTMLDQLLGALPQDANVAVALASGKGGAAAGRIRVALVSSWLADIAEPLQNPVELAPTVLNYYGLPADRLMAASRFRDASVSLAQKVDYGEPIKRFDPSNSSDSDYYEELRSLGYVQ